MDIKGEPGLNASQYQSSLREVHLLLHKYDEPTPEHLRNVLDLLINILIFEVNGRKP